MLEHLKSLARHSSVYTISTFIQRALGFIMLPIYTDTVYIPSRSAYGDLTLIYTFIAFVTIVYLYGMDAAIMRYFFIGKFDRKTIYSTGFIAVLVNSALLSLLLFIAAPAVSRLLFGSSSLAVYVKIAAAILFLDGLGNLPYLLLRAEEKSITYSAVRIARFVVELGLNILFVVVLRKGVPGILYANLLASFLNLVWLVPYQMKFLRPGFDRQAFKTLLLFGLPMLPNGLAYLTVEVSDKYLMRLLLDKDTLGVYSANYKFGSLLLLVVIAFRTAWQPFFLKISGQANSREIYARVLTYFTLIGSFIVFAGSYLVDYVVRLPLGGGRTMMGASYWPGIRIIPVILASYLFYGLYVNFTVGIYIKKKTKYMVLFTGLGALVNVVSNLLLMPRFGIMGAAFSTLLSYLAMAVSIFIANQKIYPIGYEYGRVLAILCLLAAALGLFYLLDISWYIRLVMLAAAPLLFVLTGFIKPAEIAAIRKIIRHQ